MFNPLRDAPFIEERRKILFKRNFQNLVLEITEKEVELLNPRGVYAQFVIRKIEDAIQTELTRPLREVLNMPGARD